LLAALLTKVPTLFVVFATSDAACTGTYAALACKVRSRLGFLNERGRQFSASSNRFNVGVLVRPKHYSRRYAKASGPAFLPACSSSQSSNSFALFPVISTDFGSVMIQSLPPRAARCYALRPSLSGSCPRPCGSEQASGMITDGSGQEGAISGVDQPTITG
jgi:hypothetical protein